ncbi:hypothetical protein [Methylohalobius crimeensis]|uniref:hypothetical protein n=1 Tax=Methylohalobius crimeensis TaxID=244365 RepID=UPI0003B4D68A|nr:hypothetical protein [Methylohalobius crimeensis]
MISSALKSLAAGLISLILLGTGSVWAAESTDRCGKVRFLKDKSRGVEVRLNACMENDEVAEGAILRLAPEARLWLRVSPAEDTIGESQIICQSRAESPLPIMLESADPPRLKSNLLDCGRWDQKRLSCNGVKGESNIFFCVLARFEKPSAEKRPKKGTSVVLRSFDPGASGLEDRSRQLEELEAIKNEAQLCHELYGVEREFRMEWEVDATGKVIRIAPNESLEKTHPDFAACLLDAIRFHDYPPSARTVFLSGLL